MAVSAADAGLSLRAWLEKRRPDLSRRGGKRLFREGRVAVNGRQAKPDLRLREGDWVEVASLFPAREERRPAGAAVLYEDEWFLAVDKPAGIACLGGAYQEKQEHLLARLRRAHPGKKLELFHRLDKDTSGVLMLLKGRGKPQEQLLEEMKQRRLRKEYLALVEGVPRPATGTVNTPLSPGKRLRRVVTSGAGVSAVTYYAVEEEFRGFSLLAVRIETGRMHQIRIHLASRGHPLAVDGTYGRGCSLRLFDCLPPGERPWCGNRNPLILGRVPLHACRLAFRHPVTGKEMAIEAPLPPDLERALSWLRMIRDGRGAGGTGKNLLPGLGVAPHA